MSSQLQKKQWEAQAAAQREENFAVYERWLQKHPEIYDCIATRKVVAEWCGFDDLPVSIGDLDFALSNGMDRQVAKQRVPTEAEAKAALIDQIAELIASKDGTGRDGKFSTVELKKERAKMQFWSVQELTTRRDEIVRKQSLTTKPIHELQQQVRDYHAAQNQRPALPAEYTPERIKDRSFPVSELKRLIRMYGTDAVNDRLFGRS